MTQNAQFFRRMTFKLALQDAAEVESNKLRRARNSVRAYERRVDLARQRGTAVPPAPKNYAKAQAFLAEHQRATARANTGQARERGLDPREDTWTVADVIDEAGRLTPEATPHVEVPLPPFILDGINPRDVQTEIERDFPKAKDAAGKKLRRNTNVLMSDVASWPNASIDTLLSKAKGKGRQDLGAYLSGQKEWPEAPELWQQARDWLKESAEFAKRHGKGRLRSCVLHVDEARVHWHGLYTPQLEESGRYTLEPIHAGIRYREEYKRRETRAGRKPQFAKQLAEYKRGTMEARRAYYGEVSRPSGHLWETDNPRSRKKRVEHLKDRELQEARGQLEKTEGQLHVAAEHIKKRREAEATEEERVRAAFKKCQRAREQPPKSWEDAVWLLLVEAGQREKEEEQRRAQEAQIRRELEAKLDAEQKKNKTLQAAYDGLLQKYNALILLNRELKAALARARTIVQAMFNPLTYREAAMRVLGFKPHQQDPLHPGELAGVQNTVRLDLDERQFVDAAAKAMLGRERIREREHERQL